MSNSENKLDYVHHLLSEAMESTQTAMKIISEIQLETMEEEGRLLKEELAAARKAAGKTV